jgi:curved DNA-binding protein CbpA
MTLPDSDDPYVLLDVRPGASAEQIRRAYLRRVKVWKPDRHPAEFRRVREAYDRLREHERWFDAWRQAGEVVRRAAEEAARAEADDPSQRADAATDDEPADAEDETDAEDAEWARAVIEDDAAWERSAAEDADDDVDALIAALEEELREHPEVDDDGEPRELDEAADRRHGRGRVVELDDVASERRRRSTRAAELDEAADRRRRSARAAELAARVLELEQAVHAALEAGRWAAAADLLLEPETEALASRPELAPLLLEVCCAVVWELPPRFQALVARYGDLVSAHDTQHHDGALLHRRTLESELPAWRLAVAGCPELHRFLVLGSSLRAPAEAELGLRLGKRAAADPAAFLQVLASASEHAPGIVTLYVGMAERWARHYGKLSLHRPARKHPTLEQAAAALADVAQHHRRVRWEQARPLLVSLAMLLVLLLAPTPLIELAVIGLVMVLWAWRAWAADPESRIYVRVLRPAAAAWLWSTHATPEALAEALRARLPAPGTWGAVVHPGDLGEYPTRLRTDLVLLAFGATSPMIPLLRAPTGAPVT